MVHRGRVKNGVVVLDKPGSLPEGAEVSVSPLRRPRKTSGRRKRPLTLYERLKPIIGIVKGLPPDAASNVDHYLYGMPKK